MAGIDITLTREYFELNGFLVRQLRKYQPAKRTRKSQKKPEDEVDLIIYNPDPVKPSGDLNFMLFTNDLPQIHRAIVSVKGWHTQRFSPATLKSSSEIFNFLEKDILKQTEQLFASTDDTDTGSMTKILVVPGLPTQEPHKSQSIELLRSHGVDAILSFRSMLQEIVKKVEVNHNYGGNDVLQLIRIMKNYDMVQSPQMELFNRRK